MKRLRFCSFVCVAIYLLVSPWVEGAEAETPAEVVGGLSFVGEVELTVVNIEVFVRDKAGKPVTNLEQGDFRIFQDGQERDLSHFAVFSEDQISRRALAIPSEQGFAQTRPDLQSEAEVAPASMSLPEVKPIHIVFFIDNENIRPMDRNRILTQVRTFVREIMYPHVQVMVVTYQRSLKTEQTFTNDPKLINETLREIRKMTGGRPEVDTERKKLLKEMSSVREGGADRTPGQHGGMVQINLEGMIRSYADQRSNDLEHAINKVREVMTTLSGLSGRKYLVHVSSGLPMVPALDLMNEFGSIFQNRSILPMRARYDKRRLFNGLAAAANAQGVNFLTIDASGLGSGAVSAEYGNRSDPMTAAIHVNNNQEPLVYLAEKTGGRAIINSNDITDGLEDFRQDLFSYYSLGYTINSSGADKVHRVDVEVPEHKDYQVIHRRAFVEKSLESQVQDRVFSGLIFDVGENPMAVQVKARSVAPASGDRWILPVEVGFPLESIALIPEGEGNEYVGRVAIFLAARDEEGNSTLQRHDHDIRIPAQDYLNRRDELYVVEMQLLMEEGRFRIAVGVMDIITRQASYVTIREEVSGGL